MKLIVLSVISFCIISILSSGNIQAQGFNSITTPDGVNLVAVGNAGKVYRSASGGTTYSSSSVSGSPELKSVTSFGNDVWMCGQNGNVIKTLKTTSPFTAYNTGTSNTLNSVTFINSNTGYVCGDGGVIYKTVNGGVNWSSSNTGIAAVNLRSIAFADSDNGTVVGDNGTIYVTFDAGASWSAQTSGTANNLLKVKYFGSNLYATGEYGTILSGSGGVWTSIVTRTKSDIRGLTGTSVSDVHVCGGGGFIRNNKSGSSNFFNFEKNPMLANLTDIFYYDANKGWAVSPLNRVIIYTTDGGVNWQMPAGSTVAYNWVAKTPNGSGIGNNLQRHPHNREAMFVVYGNKVYRSADRGDNWTQIGTIGIGSRAHSFYVSPVDTNIWMAAMENTPDCIVRSTNYGATWTNILARDFSTYGQPMEMDQNNPSVFYFAPSNSSGEGVYKSTNNGASFSLVAPYNNSGIGQPCDLIIRWDHPNEIYMGDDGADIWKSTDAAATWALVKPNSSSEVPSMCNSVFENTICYATTWGSSEVYRTVNSGNNWSIVSNNSGSGWGSDLCQEDPTVVLTGTYGSKAFLTTNSGSSFFDVNTGLSGVGAGIMVPERDLMLNMQTSTLYKLNIVYTDTPVLINIDVQALSIGASGAQYFESPTIIPSGVVKNNNASATATFTVTRRISPGNYVSTKTINNLAASGTANVNFDSWTFNAGTSYTVSDSVYIINDADNGNDVISGNITPYLGSPAVRISEDFTGTFPPKNWVLNGAGTMYWQYNAASSYGLGVGSAKYNFWSASNGTNQSMLSADFPQSVAGDSLEYDYAYAPYSGTTDSLIIESSTNNGATYSNIVARLYGNTGASGIYSLNTTTSGGNFTPTAGQWLKRKWSLPAGTNKIKFRAVSGFGDNLYIDDIKINSGSLYTQFNITLTPEGLYNGSTMNMKDTVKAYLRNSVSPFAVVDSAKSVIDSVSFTAPFVFKNANTGNYYIQIIHRNALETWSKNGGESLTKGITANYDFTFDQTQAFGSNLVLKNSKWCLYSGDVIVNGIVDLADVLEIYNRSSEFAAGYIVSDLTGDGLTDLSDLILGFNNAASFVSAVTPSSSPSDLQNIKKRLESEFMEFSKVDNSR
jgi:photosystem II stability/assembly factor-like uncharacterized protein